MIKHFCDRCGKEIFGELYYITITSDSLTSLNGYDYRQTLASASCNVSARLSMPKSYCKNCRDEIEEILKKVKKALGEETLMTNLFALVRSAENIIKKQDLLCHQNIAHIVEVEMRCKNDKNKRVQISINRKRI